MQLLTLLFRPEIGETEKHERFLGEVKNSGVQPEGAVLVNCEVMSTF